MKIQEENLGFTFRKIAEEVHIFHRGKKATVLRGRKADEFLDDADSFSDGDGQQLMARITGNYKRGNEKLAKQKQNKRLNNF